MSKVRVEWMNAPGFAEVAEVIGLPTDHIIGVYRQRGAWCVLWSEHVGDDAPIWIGVMERDDEHILRMRSSRRTGETVADMVAQIEARLEP